MKETLEEAAERFAEKYKGEEQDPWFDFMEGAKWQQERSYSEEDMREAIMFGVNGMYGYQIGEEGYTDNQIKKFLEQFKKK